MNQPMHSLVIFRGLLDDEIIRRAVYLTESGDYGIVDAYADFASALFEHTENWSRYLLDRVLENENLYLRRTLRSDDITPALRECLAVELETLRRFSLLSPSDLELPSGATLPAWRVEKLDFAAIYAKRLEEIPRHGYGIYARYRAFRLEGGELKPVSYPDEIRLDQLVGYERERGLVLDNTRALLRGAPAANVLLYGDSGTGKSSTVKAVANELAEEGLRLVQLGKEQLHFIPALLDRLGGNPLKFILYIDDLSFTRDDDNYRALKAVLEGSVASRRQNVVVYATSNRRHLVRESFTDREGDEVHVSDTLEEQLSLSDRFGLTVTFSRPDKGEFMAIVKSLAGRAGIEYDEAALTVAAQAFALRRGGRSPRVARQFVESLMSRDSGNQG